MYQLNPAIRRRLFDGDEAALEQQSFGEVVGHGGHAKRISFFMRDFVKHPLHRLLQHLSQAEFDQLVRDSRFKKGMGVVEHYVNDQDLDLYYFPYSGDKTGDPSFVLIAFGEVSPGRYIVDLQGLLELVVQ